jgi:hypothetical protein
MVEACRDERARVSEDARMSPGRGHLRRHRDVLFRSASSRQSSVHLRKPPRRKIPCSHERSGR